MRIPAESTPQPSICPFCGSSHIVTVADVKGTAKMKDADRYWRCETCREMWNPGRLKPHGRPRSSW